MQPSLTLVAAMLLNAAVAAEPPVAVTAQVQQTSAENAERAVPRKPVISGRWRTLVSKAQIDNPDIQCGQIVEDRSYAGVKVAPLEWIEDAGPQHGSPEPQELKP